MHGYNWPINCTRTRKVVIPRVAWPGPLPSSAAVSPRCRWGSRCRRHTVAGGLNADDRRSVDSAVIVVASVGDVLEYATRLDFDAHTVLKLQGVALSVPVVVDHARILAVMARRFLEPAHNHGGARPKPTPVVVIICIGCLRGGTSIAPKNLRIGIRIVVVLPCFGNCVSTP